MDSDGIKHLLKDHAYRNIPLNFREAFDLGEYALSGCGNGNCGLEAIQSISVLCALHTKATYMWQAEEITNRGHKHALPKTSADQIAGVCAAIFEADIAKSELGFLSPDVSFAMDNSGMGGDLIVTPNVSTLSAFIAAAAGIPVCKHGSPANADTGRHGSSDFVSLCGINPLRSKKEIEECLETTGFTFIEALDTRFKKIHTQTHVIAQLPHMNDIIGPITNPLDPKLLKRRVLGVNHLIPPGVVAQAYKILNDRGITFLEHGIFVRGFGNSKNSGMDELSICDEGTQVAELRDGRIKEYWLYAEDFGVNPVSEESISPPRGMSKGSLSLAILRNEVLGAPAQMVAANAALLFYLAGRSVNLRDCYKEAIEILASGAARRKMLEVCQKLPRS